MPIRYAAGYVACAFLLFCGVAGAATPTGLTVHGPSTVHESSSADYAAVVSWSDGTRSRVNVLWNSSVPGVAGISPSGRLVTSTVSSATPINISATWFGPSGPLGNSKPVTILDASAFPTVPYSLAAGWNLVGNSIGAPINAISTFGDALNPVTGVSTDIVSVWKWDAVNARWAFFTPTMTPPQLAAYAASKNYAVLQVIQPGEAFWINTVQAMNLPPRAAGAVFISSTSIVNAWNLLSTGHDMTPREFNILISEVPPGPGMVPQSFLTLWAWDAGSAKWLFYAPSLEASGGSAAVCDYAQAHNYLCFEDGIQIFKRLGHGVGFWVNSATENAASNLAPLGQAKAMFSELRTTVRAYSNDLKGGFLDQQTTRIRNELHVKVAPRLPWALRYGDLIQGAVQLIEDIRAGNTASYTVQAGTVGGTVRANRVMFSGSEQITCFSNDMAGAQVTAGLLTSANCNSLNFDFDAWTYAFDFVNFVSYRIQVQPRVNVLAGATANDFTYEAIKRERRETWNGSFYSFTSNTQIGPTRTGTFTRTYVGTSHNLASFSFTGDLPSGDPGADRDTVVLSGTRTVLNAPASVYRSSISGSIASKNAGGVAMVTLSVLNGSYFDSKQDANGYPLPDSLQAVHVVGVAETSATRFTGTLDLGAFATDADHAENVPTSLVFEGMAEDLSPGGAGTFLTGRLTVTVNNLAAYHSQQPESASNFLRFDVAFVGTVNATSRPEMRLTAGSSRTGVDTYVINTSYSYGAFSVTGTGVLDTANTDNSTLTVTNQAGVAITIQPHVDATVTKGGATLGVIPFGSAIVYFVDGYFESL